MANLILFKPRSEVDAEGNLRDFIEYAKTQLTAFGAELDFESDSWDITKEAKRKDRQATVSLHFTGFPSGRGQKDGTPMSEPFKSFAKAYMRYSQSFSDTTVASHRISAMRALSQSLAESLPIPSPVYATLHHFQRAGQILADRYTTTNSDGACSVLERMSEFLIEHRLCAIPVAWRKVTQRSLPTTSRVGPEFDAKRSARLPSAEALGAIAEIFHMATEPSDVFVTSACALLSSAPSRINELLHLPANCDATATDSEGQPVFGLRWRPSKGGDAVTKWVVPSMVSVAQEAVAKLQKLSAEARVVACWYEQNPGQIYLPPHLEHLRQKERLNNKEVSQIVFRDPPNKLKPEQLGAKWCSTQKIKPRWEGGSPAQGGCNTVAFADVEQAVLKMLPRNFPIANPETGLRYSEALCIALRNEMTATLATYRCAFVLVDAGIVYTRLVGRSTVKSVFEKFGYKDEHGRPLRLTSHQFRHYLNTLAQMGGLSQLDIAKWSGRAKVAQNAVYDHQSDRDVLAKVRAAIGDENKMFGPLAHTPKNTLITRDQFATLRVLTAHTTDFGYCVHDFTMLPCQAHRDCLNCDEQVCIKGDAVREQAIRMRQKETQTLLDNAKEAVEDGEFVANRWVAHQSLTLQRLDQLCAILDDPTVPDGAFIQPAGVVPASRLEQAAQQRALRAVAPQLPAPTTSEYETV